jgi:hypothetical protein
MVLAPLMCKSHIHCSVHTFQDCWLVRWLVVDVCTLRRDLQHSVYLLGRTYSRMTLLVTFYAQINIQIAGDIFRLKIIVVVGGSTFWIYIIRILDDKLSMKHLNKLSR